MNDSLVQDTDIAIIAMSCRFPGADSPEAFWQNLSAGIESITAFTDQELLAAGVPEAVLKDPAYVKAGSRLSDVESFDAAFFGFTPNEAATTDPQHRLFLECAWEALERAGYTARADNRIGVFGGCGMNTYLVNNLLNNRNALEQANRVQILTQNDKDFLSTKVSYKLGLLGPSVNVNTACSTSLVAVHMACQSILNGECDMALAGGVTISVPVVSGYQYQEGLIYSPDGHCRAFDAKAAGTVFGSGVGLVVLKSYDAALQQGDRICAVIKGSAVNNDGALKVHFTAPSVEGQSQAIAEAQGVAGIDPASISYVEAHGTGTNLGDPIEIQALTRAFRAYTDKTGYCAIGSVKTNLGHLDAAAGVAGLIKTVLALQHRKIPPSLNFETPNPQIDFSGSPFYVNHALQEWEACEPARRAGVSSFGVGGTNAHLVLEEAALQPESEPVSRTAHGLLLSAKTAAALETMTDNLADYLEIQTSAPLADVAFTLATGRKTFEHRRALVCRDRDDAVSALKQRLPDRVQTVTREVRDPGVVFLFPGQGSQRLNMAEDLYRQGGVFAEQLDLCADHLAPSLGFDIRNVLYPESHQSAAPDIDDTLAAQPLLFAVEYALARTLMSWGVKPEAMIGHSIGEYVAACLAGVFSLQQALLLVAERARLMQQLPRGAMLAVALSEAEIRPFLDASCSLAAINGPNRCVVSGTQTGIADLALRLKAQKVPSRPVKTSHAFHSQLMEPAAKALGTLLEEVDLKAPSLDYVSNLTGTWITAAEATDPGYWVNHLLQPVQFYKGMGEIIREPGRVFLEVGPGNALIQQVSPILTNDPEALALTTLVHQDKDHATLDHLAHVAIRLWLSGVPIEWQGYYGGEKRQRVLLPTYAFERQRHWIQGDKSRQSSESPEPSKTIKTQKPEPTPQAEPAPPAGQRKDRILAALKSEFTKLTGLDLSTLDPTASFLEIGLDSLTMIQAGQVIQKRFGVKIGLRRLLEEFATLDAVVAHLDRELTPDQFAEPITSETSQPGTPVQVAPSAPSNSEEKVEPGVDSALAELAHELRTHDFTGGDGNDFRQQLVLSQLDLMRKQLALFSGDGIKAGHLAASRERAEPKPSRARKPAMPGAAPSNPAREATKGRNQKFGPFKPVDASGGELLAPGQKKYLTRFIGQYNQRTLRSKQGAQTNRPFLADARSVPNFHRSWKDLAYPLTIARAEGSQVWDADGNRYLDLIMGLGVALFGHNPDFVTAAIEEQMELGPQMVGPQNPLSGRVARKICQMTHMDRVYFCNTGSEAVGTAIRLARAATGKSKIAFFKNSYHGNFDSVLISSRNLGDRLQSVPVALGIAPYATKDAVVLDYDSQASLEYLRNHAHEFAAVLVEPVQSRHPDLQPKAFLQDLRKLTEDAGCALIFDEMITGFRIHPAGCQGWFGIAADLATYGKVIGGGMPIGVVAGKAAFMNNVDGGMWQFGDDSYPTEDQTFTAGTFCQHPLAMAAADAVLTHLETQGPDLQTQLNQQTDRFSKELNGFFEHRGAPLKINHIGSAFFCAPLSDSPFNDLLNYHLIHNGIRFFAGLPNFLSTAHTEEDIAGIMEGVKGAVLQMQEQGFFPRPVRSTGKPTGATPAPSVGLREVATEPGVMPPADRASQKLDFSLSFFGTYEADYRENKYDLLFEGAKFADDNRFAGIWIPERHFYQFGGFSPNPSVLAAALARETKQLQIRAGSVVLPLHHPIRVAEEWSLVDNLSEGRVGVAIASGWHPNDFVFSPESFGNHKQSIFGDIETVQKLWRGETIQAAGGKGKPVDVRLFPMPRQDRLPMWLTIVRNPETFEQAGQIGAGILTNLVGQNFDDLKQNIERYRQALVEAGHPPEAGKVTVLIHTFLQEDKDTAVALAREPFLAYLESSAGLFKSLVDDQGLDFDRLSPEDKNYILNNAYETYTKTAALIGSPESCVPIVRELKELGVTELACFVDFGVAPDLVSKGFPFLRDLMNRWACLEGREETESGGASTGTNPDDQSLPLTEPQREVWVAAQMSENGAYNLPLMLSFQGPLDAASLEWALKQVVARHDALRITIDAHGGHQQIHDHVPLLMPVVDLSSLDRKDKQAALEMIQYREGDLPLDFSQGPLVRMRLIKCEANRYQLTLTTNQIVCDGWSTNVLIGETGALYRGRVGGPVPSLKKPVQFGTYAREWLRQSQGTAATEAKDFWLNRFKDGIPVLDLPTDGDRPPIRTHRGDRRELQLGEPVYSALKQHSTASGCTLYMTLLAAFKVLLSRLSGQNDMVVGIPVNGQLAAGYPDLIGHCASLLPLRTRPEPNLSFMNFLSAVKDAVFETQEYQHQTLGSLIRLLKPDRDPSRPPLISVLFNLDRGGNLGTAFGIPVSVDFLERRFVNFEISFDLLDQGDRLDLTCEFNRDLFEAATINRWLDHFKNLLQGIVVHSEEKLASLPLLNLDQRKQALEGWNQSDAPVPEGACVHHLFQDCAARMPSAVALVSEDERGNSHHLTFSALNRKTTAMAHRLSALGVAPDTLVGICSQRCPQLIISLLAVLKAGGAYLPLDPGYPPERLTYMLEDSGAGLLLVQEPFSSLFAGYGGPVALLEKTLNSGSVSLAPPEPPVTPANMVYMIYTSGSTGRPKGVITTHQALVNYSLGCMRACDSKPGERSPIYATLAFDATVTGLFPTLLSGGCLWVLPEGEETERLTQLLTRVPCFGVMKCIPSLLQGLDARRLAAAPLGSPRVIVCGGEPLTPAILRPFLEHMPLTRFVNHYGPTETTVGVCTEAVCPQSPLPKTIPIGRPLANARLFVLDPMMNPVPPGVSGQLYIGGLGLARGYWNRPALTATRFICNPYAGSLSETRLYVTGDRALYLADGRIEFQGRSDHQVKIRGFRVEPGEIEAHLDRHPEIERCAVAPKILASGHTVLVAYVVPVSGAATKEVDLLQDFLREKLPPHMVPQVWMWLDQLPLTPNRKVDRSRLPQPSGERPNLKSAYSPPDTPLEKELVVLWQTLLGLERVGVHDNFFALGGDSLLLMQLGSWLRENYLLDVALRNLFEAPTVAALAKHLEALRRATSKPEALVQTENQDRKEVVF